MAIKKTKAEAWRELISSLNEDPWGRSYKLVMNKLRQWAPPITQGMDPQLRERVVSALFPADCEGISAPPFLGMPEDTTNWSSELGVTAEKLRHAVRRLRKRNTAPGPDGVHGRVLALASSALGDRLRQLFDCCLRTGRFPPQ